MLQGPFRPFRGSLSMNDKCRCIFSFTAQYSILQIHLYFQQNTNSAWILHPDYQVVSVPCYYILHFRKDECAYIEYWDYKLLSIGKQSGLNTARWILFLSVKTRGMIILLWEETVFSCIEMLNTVGLYVNESIKCSLEALNCQRQHLIQRHINGMTFPLLYFSCSHHFMFYVFIFCAWLQFHF